MCDDSPTIAHYVALILGPSHEFLLVASAEEALAKAASSARTWSSQTSIMPGIDGYELCRKLRAQPELQERSDHPTDRRDERRFEGYGPRGRCRRLSLQTHSPTELLARVKSLLRLRT